MTRMSFFVHAQDVPEAFSTPGTGETYTLTRLATESEGALVQISSGVYHLLADVTITSPDKFEVFANDSLKEDKDTRLFCHGKVTINPNEEFVVTSISNDIAEYGYGIHIETGETCLVKNATFKQTGGLRLSNCNDILVEDCRFLNNKYSTQMSSAIVITNSKPHIKNCEFKFNQRSAISSGANVSAVPIIENCLFYGNNVENRNYPQINLGPGSENDTTKIIGCHIEGASPGWAQAGAISIATMIGGTATAIIDGNTIIENRYGVAGTGNNITLIVTNNLINNNNHEANPNNGGSGLNITNNSATSISKIFASNNIISNNIWGVTVIGPAKVNFGNLDGTATDHSQDAYNIGRNIFRNNGNTNIAACHFANNGVSNQKAENNDWGVYTAEEIEEWLMHGDDKGFIDYEPFIVPGPYETEGTGRTFTINDLVESSFGALTKESDGLYYLNYNITITAPDQLEILEDCTVKGSSDTRIYCYGKATINPPNSFVFTSIDDENTSNYAIGIQLYETSVGSVIKNMTIEKACGLKFSNVEDILVEDCKFFDNAYKSTHGSGAIAFVFAASDVTIRNCEFRRNARAAIVSGGNGSAVPVIDGCTIIGNNTANGNYPQINLASGTATDTIKVINNHIEGSAPGWQRAGGISFGTIAGGDILALVDNNTVINNRFGIAGTGNNIKMIVTNNTVKDNNKEGNPNLGGSGLNLLSSTANSISVLWASNNHISGSLWGITLQGNAKGNFGNPSGTAQDHGHNSYNPGLNVFRDNGNTGSSLYNVCHLFNNTPIDQYAINNDWGVYTDSEVEAVIIDNNEDPAFPGLGDVSFMPYFIPSVSCDAPTNLQAEAWEWMPRATLTWEFGDAKKSQLPKMSSSITSDALLASKNKEDESSVIHDNITEEVMKSAFSNEMEIIGSFEASRNGNNIYDQVVFVTHPGQGSGGANVSATHSGLTTLGTNVNKNSGYWVSDDFTVFSDFTIDEIDFFVYQTGSGTTSTITAASIEIWDASPLEGGECIWTTSDNMMVATEFTNCYRTGATTMTSTDRPIMKVTAGFENASFPAGTYWIAASFLGSVNSGPWALARDILGQRNTGNALMHDGSKWYAWRDESGAQNGLPFVVRGTAEPTNIDGFNVYRDGVLVNQSPIIGYEYTDLTLNYNMEYCYTAKTVYNDECGLSEASNSSCTTTMSQMPDCNQAGNPTHVAYSLPVNTYFYYSFSEQIFLANELNFNARFNIEQISVAFYYNKTLPKNNIAIYMGTTSKASFDSKTDWIPVSEMTEVFSGDIIFDTVDEDGNLWFPITLDNPFQYTGGNIVIAFLNGSGTSASGNASTFSVEEGMAGKVIHAYRNTEPFDANNLPEASSNTYNYRSILKFCGETSINNCPEVTNLDVTVNQNAATVTWDAPEETPTGYQIYLQGVEIAIVDELTYTFNNLANGNYTVEIAALYDDDCDPVKVSKSFTIIYCPPVTNLSVTFGSDCEAILTWNAPTGITNPIYDIYRDNTLIAEGITAETYTDSQFNFTISHEWCITAMVNGVESISVCVSGTCSLPFYIITATASAGGIINPSGTIPVLSGRDITFTFVANTGYTLKQVLVDGVNVPNAVANNSYTFTQVLSAHTISAIFEQTGIAITATASEGGTIHPEGVAIVEYGGSQFYTFTPQTGYKLSQVLIDGVYNETATINQMYMFNNVTISHTIHADFELKTYAITASATTGGNITPGGVTHVTHGNSQTYTFNANDNYTLIQVLIDGVNDETAVATGNYTFNNVTAAHGIQAVFAIDAYEITASANEGGKISPEGTTTVNHGSSKTYFMIPDKGYMISKVLIDGTNDESAVAAEAYTFADISDDHTIEVIFEKKIFILTASVEGSNGEISPSGNVEIEYGNTPIFTITPNEGYRIATVLVDGENKPQAVYMGTFTFSPVIEDHSITVTFEKTTYIITALATGNGSISPEGDVEVEHGTNQTFIFTPNEGYEINNVIVDHAIVEKADSYTFDNVTEKHRIEVVFVIKTSIDEQNDRHLAVYPNPAQDKIFVKSDVKIRIIQIFDMNGKLLEEIDHVENTFAEIDMTHFATGIYLFKIDNNTIKVSKQ
jgi:hypothetical protein